MLTCRAGRPLCRPAARDCPHTAAGWSPGLAAPRAGSSPGAACQMVKVRGFPDNFNVETDNMDEVDVTWGGVSAPRRRVWATWVWWLSASTLCTPDKLKGRSSSVLFYSVQWHLELQTKVMRWFARGWMRLLALPYLRHYSFSDNVPCYLREPALGHRVRQLGQDQLEHLHRDSGQVQRHSWADLWVMSDEASTLHSRSRKE